MEFIKDILRIIDTDMEIPEMYGWFHLLFFALSITGGVLLCAFHKKIGENRVPGIILAFSIATIILEIYKIINFCTDYSSETLAFNMQWYIFPFQFCSMPMYVGLLAGITRRGKVYESLCAFLATYAVFGGLCVMFYPDQVFIDTIGINIQTMFCHGAMITMGIYLYGSGHVKLKHKTILKALPVFATAIFVAMVMNEIAFYIGVPENDTFNMFFISRHFNSTLPLYSLIHNSLPFPIAVTIYFTGFSLAAYIMLLLAMGINKLAKFIQTQIKGKIKTTDIK